MKTIPVKYIDTTKYEVFIHQDEYTEPPNEWGNFKVNIFGCRDLNNCSRDDYFDDNDNLKIGIQSQLRFGTAFPVTVRHYSSTDSGYYYLADDPKEADGFITFDTAYVKGVDFEERRKYAKQDLETYQQWANGEVYWIEIKTESGREIDSCGGLYGEEGVKSFVAEQIEDAEHIKYTGVYSDGSTYETSF